MKVRARAPLRLGLAGGGTDVSPYCDEFGGLVLNATIDKYAYACLEPSRNGMLEVFSTDRQLEDAVFPGDYESLGNDVKLIAGVYSRMIREFNGGVPVPLRISTHTDAPPGSGLGSSSTLVVALVAAFAKWFKVSLSQYDLAHLAWEIERLELCLEGGRQDQYAAAFGGFNFMEFQPDSEGSAVVINPLRVNPWIISELEASMLLYFAGVSRESATIIAEQAANVRGKDSRALEATHALKHEALRMKAGLLKGQFEVLTDSLSAGWRAKRELADSISNEDIEHAYKVAEECGMRAGKVSGAGGGGFMMMMVDPVRRMDVVRGLTEIGGSVTTCHFTPDGAESWRVP